jgi:hypothetical protein
MVHYVDLDFYSDTEDHPMNRIINYSMNHMVEIDSVLIEICQPDDLERER